MKRLATLTAAFAAFTLASAVATRVHSAEGQASAESGAHP